MALSKKDLGPNCSVLDLGCGTGMLALGCAWVDCDVVIGVDCDAAALQVAAENANELFGGNIDNGECHQHQHRLHWVQAKVKHLPTKLPRDMPARHNSRGGRNRRGRGGGSRKYTPEVRGELRLSDDDDDGLPFRSNCVDTVLTNPPFGTKQNAGMDLQFLRSATRLARRAVYSFHKTSTRQFMLRTIQGWGMEVQVVAQMQFDLPKVYNFHKEKSVDVQVDLIQVILPVSLDILISPPGVLLRSTCHDQDDGDE
jgi:rRNA N6-adenosine-methyltransferase METTL5